MFETEMLLDWLSKAFQLPQQLAEKQSICKNILKILCAVAIHCEQENVVSIYNYLYLRIKERLILPPRLLQIIVRLSKTVQCRLRWRLVYTHYQGDGQDRSYTAKHNTVITDKNLEDTTKEFVGWLIEILYTSQR